MNKVKMFALWFDQVNKYLKAKLLRQSHNQKLKNKSIVVLRALV